MWIYRETSSLIAYKLVEIFTAGKNLAEFIVTETSILPCAIKTIGNVLRKSQITFRQNYKSNQA